MPQPGSDYRRSLPPEERRRFDRIVALLGRRDPGLTDFYAAAGEVVAIGDAVGGYGRDWVGHLSIALAARGVSLSRSYLYKLVKLAGRVTPEEAVRLAERGVPRESAVRLAEVEDAVVRARLLGELLDRTKALPSTRAFRGMALATHFRPARGGVRSSPPSAHPYEAVRALRKATAAWLAAGKAWTGADGAEGALDRTAGLTPAEVTLAFQGAITEAAMELIALTDVATVLAKSLGELAKQLGEPHS